MTINPNDLPTNKLYGYLTSTIAPRPIAFAATIDAKGSVNLSPYSFFNVFSVDPPILIFAPVRRTRDNTTKDTLKNLREIPEVVINLVDYTMAEQMSLASGEYERGVNEFLKAGFTAMASESVRPPRVAEARVAFECQVDRIIDLGDGPGAGSLVLARLLLMHVKDDFLNEAGKVDQRKLDLIGRMGGTNYLRVNSDGLFSIARPGRPVGIGVDALPQEVRESKILTGSDLARLGNQAEIPDAATIERVAALPEVQKVRARGTNEIHRLAKQWLAEDKPTSEALALLLGR